MTNDSTKLSTTKANVSLNDPTEKMGLDGNLLGQDKTKFVNKKMIEVASTMKIRKHEQKLRISNEN